jgi:tetratricopeptide (TPR) repeat protein
MNWRLLPIALLTQAFCWTQSPAQPKKAPPLPTHLSKRAAVDLAHASTDERIQIYQALLENTPDDMSAEIGLASTCLQKLRESGDGTYLDLAAKLVDTMLRQDGGSLTTLRLQNEIDLQRHAFKAVAERARDLIRFSPSDPGVWATLGDASMELGEYDEAGNAYLKMFALRPNLASYNRLAYFRFVTGDVPNAITLMKNAVEAGDPQPENVAWCWAELGDIYFKTGKIEEASRAFHQALDLFSTLHRAYAGLAKIEASKGRLDSGIRYYLHAQSIVPLVEYAFGLEDLYVASGQPAKAHEQQALIDVIQKLGKVKNETTNRNLALALADHDRNLPETLRLMEAEIPVRGDVYTWDAYSWVLFKNDRISEARAASLKALKFQTPEPVFYFHAGKIAAVSGEPEPARQYATRLMSLNPQFDFAKTERHSLLGVSSSP